MKIYRTVMLVDDNAVNREIVHEILDGHYSVVDAVDGIEALALAERLQPSIVLLDVMLPGFDGYEVCRRMRRISGMDSSRIVMVSAKAMPSEQQTGFEAGADGYLVKPFDDADLWSAIRGDVATNSGWQLLE